MLDKCNIGCLGFFIIIIMIIIIKLTEITFKLELNQYYTIITQPRDDDIDESKCRW